MKKISLLIGLIAMLALSSCRSHKELVTEQTHTEDSTRIEIRERVIIVPDTVYITLPQQEYEYTTIDSISHLETDFAISDVRIQPNGSVRHTLKTKHTTIPVVTPMTIVSRDSSISVYKGNSTEKKQITPKQEKSKWDEVIISLMIVAIAICVLIIRNYRNI